MWLDEKRMRCIQNQIEKCEEKRLATARRLIFLEFLKASIADLITLLFSSLQNSEDSGDSDSGDCCAANFYHFRRPKFNFLPLPFTFETFEAKSLQQQKSLLGSMWRKSKQKLQKKLLNRLR
jgi:hypothetical protein